jgi:hypothetical protein
MKQLKMSNIEKHLNLFADGNSEFNGIKWLEPIFVAMASAYDEDTPFELSTNNEYLLYMLNLEYKDNKTYSPIEIIMTRGGLEEISDHLSSIMLQNFAYLQPADRKDLRDYLQYLFLELMNNVADHSQADGHVMTQYYSTNKKVQFAIADRGVGFLSNLQLKYNDIYTEEEAIFKALEKGVTATPQKMYGSEKNAGYGLYAMLEILKETRGSFVIISNDTLVRYKSDNYDVKKLEKAWKGVVVAFEFDEAQINFSMDDFNRNFLWGDIDEDEDYF